MAFNMHVHGLFLLLFLSDESLAVNNLNSFSHCIDGIKATVPVMTILLFVSFGREKSGKKKEVRKEVWMKGLKTASSSSLQNYLLS
jgi:hypothetical protein